MTTPTLNVHERAATRMGEVTRIVTLLRARERAAGVNEAAAQRAESADPAALAHERETNENADAAQGLAAELIEVVSELNDAQLAVETALSMRPENTDEAIDALLTAQAAHLTASERAVEAEREWRAQDVLGSRLRAEAIAALIDGKATDKDGAALPKCTKTDADKQAATVGSYAWHKDRVAALADAKDAAARKAAWLSGSVETLRAILAAFTAREPNAGLARLLAQSISDALASSTEAR
jgi:hypothetical protein